MCRTHILTQGYRAVHGLSGGHPPRGATCTSAQQLGSLRCSSPSAAQRFTIGARPPKHPSRICRDARLFWVTLTPRLPSPSCLRGADRQIRTSNVRSAERTVPSTLRGKRKGESSYILVRVPRRGLRRERGWGRLGLKEEEEGRAMSRGGKGELPTTFLKVGWAVGCVQRGSDHRTVLMRTIVRKTSPCATWGTSTCAYLCVFEIMFFSHVSLVRLGFCRIEEDSGCSPFPPSRLH